jgi:hypothetical protein
VIFRLIDSVLDLEAPSRMFPREGSSEGVYEHPVVGIGLVITVGCEHETRMDHIASASATHPMNQVRRLHCCTHVTLRKKVEYYCNCLALCLLYNLENIGSVYRIMSMIVIGHSLLY